MLKFEYDDKKSALNLKKHGIDFIQAQKIWLDSELIEIKAKSKDEIRFLVVAKMSNKHWSAIITYRGETIRIISVRRSREKEVKIYEG
ncbi:MAG: BrnT family toxin [Mariprofundaceae bacterium]|nr:BrnT family toxin [Mariprofundaceae bacterium]